MSDKFAAKLSKVKPSPTLAISAKAAALKAEGHDVISLSAGEPDFNTPDAVKDAAIAAINNNFTRYTPVDGTVELKQAIIEKFQRDNSLTYNSKQVLVSCGAKQSIYNTCQALLNQGDEVIIPAPYWVSYPAIVTLSDAEPVVVETQQEQQFKISAQQLEDAITENTKLFILCSPSNPTGMVYSSAELAALGEVLLRHPNIYILTDDIYESICWANSPFSNILMVCPDLYSRTIVINGVSKAYAMTGWRIGYAAGPEPLIKQMKKIQSQSTSGPCSISQAAATAAIAGPQDVVKKMVAEYNIRQKLVLDLLNSIPGFSCSPTEGAFYLFPCVKEAITNSGCSDDVSFSEWLLEKVNVAVVPGSAFGMPGYIRISYAAEADVLQSAIARIKELFV